MGMDGVAAMVRAAVWLEIRGGLEVLNIGRGALNRQETCTLDLLAGICFTPFCWTVVLSFCPLSQWIAETL
jgi:hypothetical protein